MLLYIFMSMLLIILHYFIILHEHAQWDPLLLEINANNNNNNNKTSRYESIEYREYTTLTLLEQSKDNNNVPLGGTANNISGLDSLRLLNLFPK